jgi:hypothetical protein
MTSLEILARVPAPRGGTPEPTISEIVSRVRQPAPLRAAMAAWRQLQEAYAAVSKQLVAAVGELAALGGEMGPQASPVVARIRETDQELGQLRKKVQSTLLEIMEQRPPWIAAVERALAPMRRAAAETGLEAALRLTDALDELAKIDTEMVTIGAWPVSRLPMNRGTLGTIIEQLCRLTEQQPWPPA